ncbi:hypothetical protein D3C73_1420140 [compost metagenome]
MLLILCRNFCTFYHRPSAALAAVLFAAPHASCSHEECRDTGAYEYQAPFAEVQRYGLEHRLQQRQIHNSQHQQDR